MHCNSFFFRLIFFLNLGCKKKKKKCRLQLEKKYILQKSFSCYHYMYIHLHNMYGSSNYFFVKESNCPCAKYSSPQEVGFYFILLLLTSCLKRWFIFKSGWRTRGPQLSFWPSWYKNLKNLSSGPQTILA